MNKEKEREKNRLKSKKHTEKVKEHNKTHEIKTNGINQTCHKCKVNKPITDFPKDITKKSGFGGKCKSCKSENNYFDENIDPHTTKKECSAKGGCGEEKYLIYFSKQKQGKMGYANLCMDCRKIQRRSKDLKLEKPKNGTKMCNECKEEINVSKFSADKYSKDGMQSICKKCQKIRHGISYSKLSNFITQIVKNARGNAKRRNILFDITKENIEKLYEKQKGLCALSGIKMTHNAINDRQDNDSHILNPNNISIDRIDSKIGYIKSNIQLVCAIVNRIKFEMTEPELFEFCCKIVNTNKFSIIKQFDEFFGIEKPEINISEKCKKFIDYKYSNMIHNAKSRNLKCDLTKDQIIEKYKKQNGLCALTGIKLSFDKSLNDLSIDRIDSNKSYSLNNIHLISNLANSVKSDIDTKYLIKICTNLKLFYLKRTLLTMFYVPHFSVLLFVVLTIALYQWIAVML